MCPPAPALDLPGLLAALTRWIFLYLVSLGLLFIAALIALRRARPRLAAALCCAVVGVVVLFVLQATPYTLDKQPFPDSPEVADATQRLVHGGGYLTTTEGAGLNPPRYLPGFSVALAPFAATGEDFPANVQRGATFYAALYVVLASVAAWSLAGPVAGALAAILIGISPFASAQAAMILSDAFAAGLVMLFIPLLQRPTPRRIALAGLLAGALVTIRPPMAVVLAALLIVLPWSDRKRVLLFAAPFLAALALFNWQAYGSPLRTGYDYWLPTLKEFAPSYALAVRTSTDGPWVVADHLNGLLMRWVSPCRVGGPQASLSNLAFYPAVLLGLFWVYLPPLLPLIGIIYAWEQRHALAVRFSFWVIVLSLILFIFYFWQGARFMAAPATLLAVFSAAKTTQWLERWLGLRTSGNQDRVNPAVGVQAG